LSKTNPACSSESPTSSGHAVLTSKALQWDQLSNTNSDEKTLDQLVKQLRKLIDVIEVKVLDTDKTVYRELALIKIKAVDPTTRSEIVNYSTIFRGNILDIGKETITVEITGTPDKIDAFKNLVEHYGIAQLSRTGVSALPRGGVES
jgi:acetolactate synthase-1/3 small subunit